MSEHEEQAMPTPNGGEAVQAMVRRDLEERQRIGTERYGTPLQAHNGRDALRDAYEEALDLACYLRQAIAEREEPAVPLDARMFRDVDGDLWQLGANGKFFHGQPMGTLRDPNCPHGRTRDEVVSNYGPIRPA